MQWASGGVAWRSNDASEPKVPEGSTEQEEQLPPHPSVFSSPSFIHPSFLFFWHRIILLLFYDSVVSLFFPCISSSPILPSLPFRPIPGCGFPPS